MKKSRRHGGAALGARHRANESLDLTWVNHESVMIDFAYRPPLARGTFPRGAFFVAGVEADGGGQAMPYTVQFLDGLLRHRGVERRRAFIERGDRAYGGAGWPTERCSCKFSTQTDA